MIFPHPVTVRQRAGGQDDSYRQPLSVWSETATVAFVQPKRSAEIVDRDITAQLDAVAFLPADTVIDHDDQLVHGTRTYEVVGPPKAHYTPAGLSHLTVDLAAFGR